MLFTPGRGLSGQPFAHVPAERGGAVHHVFAGDAVEWPRPARPGTHLDAVGDGLGHVGEVLIEDGREHQDGSADLLGDVRTLRRRIGAIARDGDLPALVAEQPDRVTALAAQGVDEVLSFIDKDHLETSLPGQQAHVAAARGARTKNDDFVCHARVLCLIFLLGVLA